MKYLAIVILLACGCKTKHQSGANPDFIPDYSKGPPTMVYKTKGDYRALVPVMLSEDKTRIVGYPGKSDIESWKGYPLPTQLHDGYLLDNRGIDHNVAFLKLTYEEYAALDTLPPVTIMHEWILDKDPLRVLCHCGSRKAFTDIESQLNVLIEADRLTSVCRVMK
jgi:hypothetical protein